MERLLKKQIDDLIDYTLCLKKMFTSIAQAEAYPDNMNDEDKKEIKDILYIMDEALKIEDKKISKMQVCKEDFDAIEGYLLRYHEFTSYEDFAYEDNELERLRVYNKLFHKYLEESKYNRTCSKEELITDSFSRVIDSNFVYVLNEHTKNPEVVNLYSFLKYGKIFISPTYDKYYFPNLQVADFKPITHYPILTSYDSTSELIKYAKKEIKDEFKSIIDTLYNGFTNKALNNEENEIRAVAMAMAMITFLSTSLDPSFIDERFLEFKSMRKEDKSYSDVNDLVISALNESKKMVLSQNKKRN